jgi:hypothetical protein
MAFAKLSGSLLASNDAQPARGAVTETAPTPVEVGPLYDKLRDCIRASDQAGVARIFAELVRARRSVSEISQVVESLSRFSEEAEPEANGRPIDDLAQPGAASEFEQATPGRPILIPIRRLIRTSCRKAMKTAPSPLRGRPKTSMPCRTNGLSGIPSPRLSRAQPTLRLRPGIGQQRRWEHRVRTM